MQLHKREEMDPRYQWELNQIFASEAAWEAELKAVEAEIPKSAAFSGKLGEINQAKAALDAHYATLQRAERVFLYAELKKAGDNGNPAAQAMRDRAMRLLVSLDTVDSYITPELAALPEETLQRYIDDPTLAVYRHGLMDIVRGRKYVLSPQQEKMLSMLSEAAQTPDNSFTMLESVDMTFPSIRDEEGNEVPLTHGNFSVYRESRDRRVRQEAFETYLKEFKKYINTFAALYGGSVKFDNYYSDVRGQESAVAQALFAHNVPLSVYDSLIKAVHDTLPAMGKYIDLRKEVLGTDELHMYDLYNPIVEDVAASYSFDEAKALVKKALAPLGEQYAALLERAYTEFWMDVYENQGKTTGAFSCGVYGVHPYVLLNYTNTLDDVFTMAHELGHSMHSYFSDEAQDYVNHDYSIMVAEVASTVNEVLLLKYLIANEQDEKRRAYLLNHFLEGFRTTLYRQTLFAEFEKITHDMAQSGEPLTAEALNTVYRKLNEQYYPGVVVDALQEIEWARIPHFYNAFYVYQYATGYSSAVAIAERILRTGNAEEYLRFLTTGGSDYPMEELRIAGVDLSSPNVVGSALRTFEKTVDELRILLKK